MTTTIESQLKMLESNGNRRVLPRVDADSCQLIDFSSNDYLGIASREDLRSDFFARFSPEELMMSTSASRLLARRQRAFYEFEKCLEKAYGTPALILNSGYHANTGLVPALAMKGYTIIADKLVHASIIDGIKLSGVPFERFRHNDIGHLAKLAQKAAAAGRKIMLIVESVYSMDGDRAPLKEIIDIKKRYDESILYVDEAHAVGVEGPGGLGLAMTLGDEAKHVDVVVGTLGKALASVGAYAITNRTVREWLVNRARSFIFSTALPPVNVMWSKYVFEKSLEMNSERQHLKALSKQLGHKLGTDSDSHIQAYLLGSPQAAIAMSSTLRVEGFEVLPIRTPTVPPGTDRLRISLSASLSHNDIDSLANSINRYRNEQKPNV